MEEIQTLELVKGFLIDPTSSLNFRGEERRVREPKSGYEQAIGDRWATLSARAQEKGIQPSVIDGLVAAIALEDDLRFGWPAPVLALHLTLSAQHRE